jgi:hypothetical protein
LWRVVVVADLYQMDLAAEVALADSVPTSAAHRFRLQAVRHIR